MFRKYGKIKEKVYERAHAVRPYEKNGRARKLTPTIHKWAGSLMIVQLRRARLYINQIKCMGELCEPYNKMEKI